MRGVGKDYLEHSFKLLSQQTYKDFEVVVSDNSLNDVIERTCDKWSDRLNIKHVYNIGEKTMSHNFNNAIKNASRDVIKIICQDDFLFQIDSLEIQMLHFLGNANHWMVTACCHSNDGYNFYNNTYPLYHDNIHYGRNTISSPSVVMFKNEDVIEFDKNLSWLVDVDWYKRMYNTFGLPSICNYITIVNREHNYRVSNNEANEQLKKSELEYIINKYK